MMSSVHNELWEYGFLQPIIVTSQFLLANDFASFDQRLDPIEG